MNLQDSLICDPGVKTSPTTTTFLIDILTRAQVRFALCAGPRCCGVVGCQSNSTIQVCNDVSLRVLRTTFLLTKGCTRTIRR